MIRVRLRQTKKWRIKGLVVSSIKNQSISQTIIKCGSKEPIGFFFFIIIASYSY